MQWTPYVHLDQKRSRIVGPFRSKLNPLRGGSGTSSVPTKRWWSAHQNLKPDRKRLRTIAPSKRSLIETHQLESVGRSSESARSQSSFRFLGCAASCSFAAPGLGAQLVWLQHKTCRPGRGRPKLPRTVRCMLRERIH